MKTPKWAMWLSMIGAAMSIVGLLLVQMDKSSGTSAQTGSTDVGLSDSVSDPYVPDPVAAEPAPAATEAPLTSADDLKQHDKGWVLESYDPHADHFGGVSIIARIKNVHLAAETGVFTLTLLRGETVVASFQGSARGVAPEQTVTVEMISDATSDQVIAGKPETVEFQTDTSYDS